MEKTYIYIGKHKKKIPNHTQWSIPLAAAITTLVIEIAIFISI